MPRSLPIEFLFFLNILHTSSKSNSFGRGTIFPVLSVLGAEFGCRQRESDKARGSFEDIWNNNLPHLSVRHLFHANNFALWHKARVKAISRSSCADEEQTAGFDLSHVDDDAFTYNPNSDFDEMDWSIEKMEKALREVVGNVKETLGGMLSNQKLKIRTWAKIGDNVKTSKSSISISQFNTLMSVVLHHGNSLTTWKRTLKTAEDDLKKRNIFRNSSSLSGELEGIEQQEEGNREA
ncbi:hypothetical protein RUND412_005877 [Rhizina undulata]